MSENSEIKLHFLDYWRVIRVRSGIIFLAFLLVVITAAVTTYFMPKQYKSAVMMEIQPDTANMPVFSNGGPSGYTPNIDPKFIATQFQIIQQKEILYPVIDELQLGKAWSPNEPIPRERLYYMLRNTLEMQEVRNTNLIQIIASSGKPKEASEIANKIAEVYQQRRNEELATVTIKSLAKLQDEVDKQQRKVDEAHALVAKLRSENQIIDTAPDSMVDPMSIDVNVVQAVTADVTKMESAVDTLRNQIVGIDKLTDDDLMRGLAGLNIPDTIVAARLQSYQAATAEKERLLSSGLAKRHPEVQALDSQMAVYSDQIKQQMSSIRGTLVANLRIAEANLDAVRKQLKGSEANVELNKVKMSEYAEAKYRYINAKELLKAASTKLQIETIEKGMPRNPAKIWAKAEPATGPSKPNVPLNIALGVIVGLVVGIGLAFFIEYLDTSVKTLDDVESFLGLPVLAVIPKNIKLLHKEATDSADAEAYRILRTNIEFNRKSADYNAITFVSGGPGEGKSTTLANLAVTCAQGGYNVLVVDADLRRPTQHTIFGTSNAVGLSNFLTTDLQLEDVIIPSHVENLHLMPSGILPSDAVGILNSQRMSDLIADVKGRYDIILFDAPPILGVSDASVLASEVDLTVIVVQHRRFPRSMLLRVKQSVLAVGGNLLGVVLNNVDVRHDQNYQYYTSYNDYYSVQTKPRKSGRVKTPATASTSAGNDGEDY
jgi:capsular exopolysaccharide synthesis family protein